MKKLISAFTMMFLCSISYAESMKFITVLSSPVGTFNKLEAVDPDQPAKGNTVNFCTSIGTQGLVELKGTKPAALTTVSLAKNTTLGKTDEGKFSLNKIELHSGGSIRGGRLFGNIVTVNNAASGKANNLYGNQLTVVGAKTNDLTVANASYIKKGEQNSAVLTDPPDMVWSNQYQSDEACKEGASYEKCKQQYLLKSGGGSSGGDCSNVAYKGTHKSECCPEASEDDNICYADCTDEGAWEWTTSTDKTVAQILGADWPDIPCEPGVECTGTRLYGLSCWNMEKLTVLGQSRVRDFEAEFSTFPSWGRNVCDSMSCSGESDKDIYCLKLYKEQGSQFRCLNGKLVTGKDFLLDSGNYNFYLLQCKFKPGEEKRCRNGW